MTLLMKAELISIGTELLLGQIVNTNAQYLSEQLNAIGIPVYYHSVVGDNPDRLKAQLHISTKRSDLLIFTGGLGPTKDDMTKETIAQFLGCKLTIDQLAMEQIERQYARRNMHMTENNRTQATIIEGAQVFNNNNGMAPGMAVKNNGHHFLLFPGPPSELKPMFEAYGAPYLIALYPEHKVVHSKIMKFCGIGESTLEDKLQDIIDKQTSPTIAPLAHEGEVVIRLTSFSNSEEQAEQEMVQVIEEIQKRAGEFQYGWDNDRLETVLIEALLGQNLTIATAESMTGGLVSHLISSVSGASSVLKGGIVCYANDIKQKLGISTDLIATEGVVSESAARLLATNIRDQYNVDVGVSITGVAGPEPQENKTVGLIYIGIAIGSNVQVHKMVIGGNRQAIQRRAAKRVLFQCIKAIKKGE